MKKKGQSICGNKVFASPMQTQLDIKHDLNIW